MVKIQLFIKTSSFIIGLLVLLVMVLVAEYKYDIKKCNKICITLQPYIDQPFVSQETIINKIAKEEHPIYGTTMRKINTYSLLNNLKGNPFIKNVSIFKTWKGALLVNICRKKILARIMIPNHEGYYMDNEGNLIPRSSQSAKVLLVAYNTSSSNLDPQRCQELLPLLKYIGKNPFWKSQVAQIQYNNSKINIYMRIGKQTIEFGNPISIEEKFRKLQYFYKAIIPYKGWNAYSHVNLEFKNQLICK